MVESNIQQTVNGVQYAATSATGNAVIYIIHNYYDTNDKTALIKSSDTPLDEIDTSSPYRGLSYFKSNDAQLFFGRDSQIEELEKATEVHNFIPILGASGSGKSSLVFAGLIPKLAEKGSWLFTYFRLGDNPNPFEAIAQALLPLYGDYEGDLAKELKENKQKIAEVFASIQNKHPEQQLLLFADQFEQLYASCDKETQHLFLDLLLNIIQPLSNDSLPRVLVTTMRAEFLDKALSYQPFASAFKSDIKLSPMKPAELAEVIEKPASERKVEFQEGLVNRILDHVSNDENCLPLLEFALDELWKKRTKRLEKAERNEEQTERELTYGDYKDIGEVKGAIEKYANNFYRDLTSADKEQVPKIFIQLVNFIQFTQDRAEKIYVRRVAKKTEFREEDWRLVQVLADKRLVVTNRNAEGEDTVEIIHEALIREWDILKAWMDENRSFRNWQEGLRVALRQWEAVGMDEGALLRGVPLAEAEDWLQKRQEELKNEREYIEQSLVLREREKAEKERQELEKLEAKAALDAKRKETLILAEANQTLTDANQEAEQKIRYGNIYLVVSIVIGVVFLGSAAIAIHKQIEAQKGTQLEQAGINALFQFKSGELSSLVSAMQSTKDLQKLIGTGRDLKDYPAVSPVLALQKILDDIHERNYFEAGQGDVKAAVFLPGGDRFITAGEGFVRTESKANEERTLLIWNSAGTQEVSLVGHEPGLQSGVNAVSVGGDAKNPIIASAGEDGTVRLWDKSGKQIRQLVVNGNKDKESFSATAVSRDGQKIIAGQRNGKVYLWDKSGKQLKTWIAHGSDVTAISFNQDGQTLATAGDDGLARVWTITGSKLGELKHPQIKKMLGVSLSPDGKFVATASDDNRARIWTVAGQEVRRLEGYLGWVTVVNFSPDGQTVATGSDDGSVKLWNAKTGDKLQDFRGHRGAILSASFSLDGKRLVSTGKDGFVRLWNLVDRPSQGIELTGFKDDVNAIAFRPDGKTVAGAGNEGVMRLWDATSGKELKVWKEAIVNNRNVQDIAFSPDGKFIVASGLVSIPRVWDLTGSLTEPQAKLKGVEGSQDVHQGYIGSVAVSPDSQLVVTGSYDRTIRIWKPKSPNGELVAVTPEQEGVVSRVVFTADGQRIVSADWKGNVAIWDLAGKQLSKWSKVHQTQIRGLGITRDGSRIVTADKSGYVKILDGSGKVQKEFFSYQSGINKLVTSPNGQLIATGGMDGTVRLWDFQGRQVAEFRNPKGAIWGVAFSPDDRRLALAGNQGFTSVREIDSLPNLMKKGCGWLQNYLEAHPAEKSSLKVCQ